MILEQVFVWVLRLFGALWLVGGGVLLHRLNASRQIDGMISEIERKAAALERTFGDAEGGSPAAAPDRGRGAWLAAGAALTMLAGGLMLVASRWCVAALSALLIHQGAYFIRQRRRELAAATPAEALEERPTQQTRNGFYAAMIMAVLAAWLFGRDALW